MRGGYEVMMGRLSDCSFSLTLTALGWGIYSSLSANSLCMSAFIPFDMVKWGALAPVFPQISSQDGPAVSISPTLGRACPLDSFNCMFAQRRVAWTANFVGCTGAQVDEANDEIDEDLEGRVERSEYCVEVSETDSGGDAEEAEVVSDDRRVGMANSGTLGFHSDVLSSEHRAKEDSFM